MLNAARAACQNLLGDVGTDDPHSKPFDPESPTPESTILGTTGLIQTNGDAQMWYQLCNFGHAAPIRVIHAQLSPDAKGVLSGPPNLYTFSAFQTDPYSVSPLQGYFIDPASYPPDAPIGNYAAKLHLDPGTNGWPYCGVSDPGVPAGYLASRGIPPCPPSVSYWRADELDQWSIRGAINAGLAVYTYLQSLETQSAPAPDYDRCDLLPP